MVECTSLVIGTPSYTSMMRKENSPVPLDKLLWVVKYGLSKVRSHIQVLDEKHIYCAAKKGERGHHQILHDNSKHGGDYTSKEREREQIHSKYVKRITRTNRIIKRFI